MAIGEGQSERFAAVLGRYVPYCVVEAAVSMVMEEGVHLKIVKSRLTKLGDYRPPGKGRPWHSITVNGDLNRYAFLVVFLHEFAHLRAWKLYGRRVKPHGEEWQRLFCDEVGRFLGKGVFPQDVEGTLARYMSSVPLSRKLERELDACLRNYDCVGGESVTVLDDLSAGDVFRLKGREEMVFVAEEKRRTRWRCRELVSGKVYLVNGASVVEMVN